MVPLGRVVVDDVEDDRDPRLVQGLDHRLELAARVGRVGGVGPVGGEEVQRHVAPVVPLLRVVLLHREQLDDRDAQGLEVGHLLGHAGVGAPRRGRDPARRAPREAAHVHLVDDRVRVVARGPVVPPVERRLAAGQDAQGGHPGVGARMPGRLAVERRREEDLPGAGVEEDLVRVEPAAARAGARAVDRVGVVAGAAQVGLAQPAVPQVPGLVPPRVDVEDDDGAGQVVLAEEEELHPLGVPGVEREVAGLLLLDPGRPGGVGAPQDRGPARPRLPRPRPHPVDRPSPALGRGEPVRPAVRGIGGLLGGRRPVLHGSTPGGPPMVRGSEAAERPARRRVDRLARLRVAAELQAEQPVVVVRGPRRRSPRCGSRRRRRRPRRP